MEQCEVILHVEAEGGGVTLYGMLTKNGWLFSRQVIDQTPELFNEPWILDRSKTVNSWSDALILLNQYPWHKLYPLEVHPEFRETVFNEVVARHKAEEEECWYFLPDWKELCGIGAD